MKHRILALLIVIVILIAGMLAAYQLGKYHGEQSALDLMQVQDVEDYNGKYSIIVRYRADARLLVWEPYWKH